MTLVYNPFQTSNLQVLIIYLQCSQLKTARKLQACQTLLLIIISEIK